MQWKELLNVDIALLFRRKRADSVSPERPVYWWHRIARLIFGKRGDRSVAQEGGSESLSRWAKPIAWRGPVYWNSRLWRRDVVLVSEHLRSLIACNVPLAPGLAAAAQEELRLRTAWTPQRASNLVRAIAAIIVIALMGGSIAMDINGLNSTLGFAQALIMVAIAVWLLRAIFLNRASRLGVFVALERRIAAGAGLAEAMATLPRFFPRHLVDLVEAGEVAGNLDPAFDQFNDAMLHSLGLQRQLKATLVYLGVILMAQVSIASFMLVKVIPVYIEMRQEAGPVPNHALNGGAADSLTPLLTALIPDIESLVDWSQSLFAIGPMLAAIAVLVVLIILLGRFRKRRNWSGRRSASALLLLPWFRGLAVRQNLGLISLMLHGLLRAGVPLDRALALALGSDVHPAYRRWLGELRARVCQGESLKEALQSVPSRRLIPESFQGLVEAGERSGQLPEMFGRIAELYRRETERRMRVLHAIVLPAGIFVLGYMVLTIQVSVVRVLIDMADALQA